MLLGLLSAVKLGSWFAVRSKFEGRTAGWQGDGGGGGGWSVMQKCRSFQAGGMLLLLTCCLSAACLLRVLT
jgi:hypothetical protein